MESVSVTTQLLYPQEKAKKQFHRRNRVDLWAEIKERWLVFGVLGTIVLAVISPRIGAPGGPFHTKYLVYLPLSYIYYDAGWRYKRTVRVSLGRVTAVSCLHAHVVSPLLAAGFSAVVAEHTLVKPTVFASVGPPCAWLSLSLSHAALAPLAATYAVSLALTPVTMMILCNDIWIPPILTTITSLLTCAIPLVTGVWRARAEQAKRAKRAERAKQAERAELRVACLLAVLWAECSARFWDAEGGMQVGDVMFLLVLELCYLSTSGLCVYMYYRLGLLDCNQAKIVGLVALPKCFDLGWQSTIPCIPVGLSRLAGVFVTPAQSLLAVTLAGDVTTLNTQPPTNTKLQNTQHSAANCEHHEVLPR